MRSSWGRVVFGAVLIIVGLGWVLDTSGIVEIPVRVLLPIALIGIGVGLVVGARRGSHTPLIVAGVIITVILASGSGIDNRRDFDLGDDVGDNVERPLSARDLHPYRLGAGTLTIDLTRIELTKRTYKVEARVGAGRIHVFVPRGVPLRIEMRSGAGSLEAVGGRRNGIGVRLESESGNYDSKKPRFDLHLRAGVGSIRVARRGNVAA